MEPIRGGSDAPPPCVYCGEPVEGYAIAAGDGVAHEDPCTEVLCECGHDAEDHYGLGLSCKGESGDGIGACLCDGWKPAKEAGK